MVHGVAIVHGYTGTQCAHSQVAQPYLGLRQIPIRILEYLCTNTILGNPLLGTGSFILPHHSMLSN